jgi:uncharacterized protein YjlB
MLSKWSGYFFHYDYYHTEKEQFTMTQFDEELVIGSSDGIGT